MIGFDPLYFIMLGPAMLLALVAQFKVSSAYRAGKQVFASSGMSGRDAAARILEAYGIRNVGIEVAEGGELSDHYDPKAKMLRLSPDVYNGKSLASLGIAAHEVGHAIQDDQRYGMLVVRNGIVPLAAVGSNASWILLILGMALGVSGLTFLGIGLFSLVVVFQLVNLPVEFDASARAKRILVERGIIAPQESAVVARVLNAAAMTYVAATITAIVTLIYYLIQSGLLGGNRDE